MQGRLLALASDATRLIVLESPGSLTFEEVQDVAAIAALARPREILTLMDNTWAAGLLFKPLDHGIDISVQALTKYVGGHSDVFMGSVASADTRLCHLLDQAIIDFGWAVAPEDAYQMLRGLRTLPTRMARHEASALAVAGWLRHRPEVADVLFPALPGARDHELFLRDYAGAAGLFSIVLQSCSPGAVRAFLATLELFGLGFSWGGFRGSLAIERRPAACGPPDEAATRARPPRPPQHRPGRSRRPCRRPRARSSGAAVSLTANCRPSEEERKSEVGV